MIIGWAEGLPDSRESGRLLLEKSWLIGSFYGDVGEKLVDSALNPAFQRCG